MTHNYSNHAQLWPLDLAMEVLFPLTDFHKNILRLVPKGLVDRTADAGFTMKEVSADKGYLGASNMLATLQRRAIPYIPFKTNSVPDSRGSYGPKSELWSRMYHLSQAVQRIHMIKSKLGQRLRSRTLTAQINEALCKVLCHNLCVVIQSVHELGIETNFEVALP